MKQHGVFFSAFGACVVLVHYARLRPFAVRKAGLGLAFFAAGMVLPYAAICLWLWWAGVFERFWFWTFTYSRSHVSEVSLAEGVDCFRQQFAYVATPNWPLWLAALLGVLVVMRTKEARKARWFLAAFAVFAFLGVCPGFFFRNHYFIVWLPAVAIFCGACGSWLLHGAYAWRPGEHPGRDWATIGTPDSPHPPRQPSPGSESDRCRHYSAGMLLWPAAV